MKINETYKKLSKVAKENGFYLCPERVWNEMAEMVDYKNSEIKRLKKRRDDLVKEKKTDKITMNYLTSKIEELKGEKQRINDV